MAMLRVAVQPPSRCDQGGSRTPVVIEADPQPESATTVVVASLYVTGTHEDGRRAWHAPDEVSSKLCGSAVLPLQPDGSARFDDLRVAMTSRALRNSRSVLDLRLADPHFCFGFRLAADGEAADSSGAEGVVYSFPFTVQVGHGY